MKTSCTAHRLQPQGYALLLVITFAAISFLVLGAALDWCMTNGRLTDRNNQYFTTAAAAEAATEKVLSSIARDYASQGESIVWLNIENYRKLVPTTAENAAWSGFTFSDGMGNQDQTFVRRLSAASSYQPLKSKYRGMYGAASTYRLISNARMANAINTIDVGVKQDIQLATIPVFQFAIFYSLDMEVNPSPNMKITGRVHGNANINLQPVNSLTFLSDVTAAGNIIHNKHTNDPSIRATGASTITYKGEHDSGADSLTLPIGTNNSPDAVHAIIELPPDGESPTSAMGRQRYYNKSDMVVLVSNTTVTVKSGLGNGFATIIPYSEWNYFLKTNVSFYDKREGKTVNTTQLSVAKLATWSATNSTLRPTIGNRDVRSVYIADLRTPASMTTSGIKVVEGAQLPSLGLTVATPNPLYVQGNFNAQGTDVGKNETVNARPASLVGDSINILSTAWSDANSTLGVSSRKAGDTTVNAAILSGIVPSGKGYYSGGVENFPRFLEDWGGKTLTYNGSMVAMFNSLIATAPWGSADVYSPPARNWAFDQNYIDATKLPPGTPEVRAVIKSTWETVAAGSVY
jgi:hypothetical protein